MGNEISQKAIAGLGADIPDPISGPSANRPNAAPGNGNISNNSRQSRVVVKGGNAITGEHNLMVGISQEHDEFLGTVFEIVLRENKLRFSSLRALSRVCRWFYIHVQYYLRREYASCVQFLPRLARKLYPRLLKHPIKYTGYGSTIEKLDFARGDPQFGIQLFNSSPCPFTVPFLRTHMVAVSNVVLWCKRKLPFVAMLFVNCYPIATVRVGINDYMDTGVTIETDAGTCELFAADLRLPLRYNPIPLGAPIVDVSKVLLGIAPDFTPIEENGETHTGFAVNFDYMYALIDRVIVNYFTVERKRYNWKEYAMTFNGRTDFHARTYSLVRPLDDKVETKVSKEQYQQMLQEQMNQQLAQLGFGAEYDPDDVPPGHPLFPLGYSYHPPVDVALASGFEQV